MCPEEKESGQGENEKQKELEGAIKKMLEYVGENPDREGLLKTPERYVKTLLDFTKGYSENIADVVNDAIFEVDHHDLVLVKDIEIFSMCEHHIIPFMGKVRLSPSPLIVYAPH